MDTVASDAREYRVLGTAALITAAGALALWFSNGADWLLRLAVGLTTIALLSLVILLAHRGRSPRRALGFGLPVAVLVLPCVWGWIRMAPFAFGFPFGVGCTAFDVFDYVTAYRAGHSEATKDVKAGVLAIEEYGFGAGFGHRVALLRDRHQVEIRPIAQCGVNARIVGHAAGYNGVSQAVIDKRIGQAALKQAEGEGEQWDAEDRRSRGEADKLFARKISGLSSEDHVVTESVSIGNDEPLDEQNLSAADFERFIQALERLVSRATPPQPSYGELHIRGVITPSARPTVETSSGAAPNFPRSIYDEIYRARDTLPDIRSTTEPLYYYVNFSARVANTNSEPK